MPTTEREIIRAAQAYAIGEEPTDRLLVCAAEVFLTPWEPLANDHVASNGRDSFALFVPARGES